MNLYLGINTGFAVNRFSEPEEWTRIIGKDLNIKYVQFTADMLNPSLPDSIIWPQIKRIKQSSLEEEITIRSTFTGAFTRVNHLAHPENNIRDFWIEWFKRFVDISVEIGAKSMGSHFGIFTTKDNNDRILRKERRAQNIEGWHNIGKYAVKKGLKFISWEPMSISREQGETIEECRKLQDDVNNNSPIPFKLCLDVDHGDVCSKDPRDIDPYFWLVTFADESPQIHLKQSTSDKSGHWPFIEKYNNLGIIKPKKVLDILKKTKSRDFDLILEMSFREREPHDSSVINILKESAEYWRRFLLKY